MEKLRVSRVIVVEGKYDKIKLESIIDGHIITTDGFGVFRDREKADFFRRLAQARGLIVATDSDGAGLLIRNYFKSIIPPSQLFHVYIPCVKGKERRKSAPSKEGTLGLEGIDSETLRALFLPYSEDDSAGALSEGGVCEISLADLYEDGFRGGRDSAAKRRALLRAARLPENISAKALVKAINALGGREYYDTVKEKANEIFLQKA